MIGLYTLYIPISDINNELLISMIPIFGMYACVYVLMCKRVCLPIY